MADGLFNLCGRRTVDLTKDGRTYQLTIRTNARYARKESAILARMGNPYAGVESITDNAARSSAIKLIADIACRPQIATLEDEERFDHSMRGIAWSVYDALTEKHPIEFPPDLPVEQAVELGMAFVGWFSDINQIMNALYRVEEKDILKNSSGPEETPG